MSKLRVFISRMRHKASIRRIYDARLGDAISSINGWDGPLYVKLIAALGWVLLLIVSASLSVVVALLGPNGSFFPVTIVILALLSLLQVWFWHDLVLYYRRRWKDIEHELLVMAGTLQFYQSQGRPPRIERLDIDEVEEGEIL